MKRNRLRFCSLVLAVVLLAFCATPSAFASSGSGGGRYTNNVITTNAPRFKSSVYQQWVSFLGVVYDQTTSSRLLEAVSFFPGVSGIADLSKSKFVTSMMAAMNEAQAALGPSGYFRSRSYYDARRIPVNSVWTSSSHTALIDHTACMAPFRVLGILLGYSASTDRSDLLMKFSSKSVSSSDFSNWFETNGTLQQYDSVSFYYLNLSEFATTNPAVYQFEGDLPLMSATRYATVLPYKDFSGVDPSPSPSPSPSDPIVDQNKTKDKWLKYLGVYGAKGVAQIAYDYNSLVAVCESNSLDPSQYIVPSHNGTQYVIVQGVPAGEDAGSGSWKPNSDTEILCDYQGRPYVCGIQAIVDQPLPYQPDKDSPGPSGDDENQQLIDLINQIITLPNGDQYYTENVYYDYDNRSYTTNLYNITNNEYYTFNYNYTYFINYTSITYIGQTETYEAYSAYYNLPDGRSSDDLTAADLEQLSLVFQDVVPYARSADRLTLRRLFHFDGNTNDSSYWSYIEPAFEWVSGASITYMDAGTFNGALYLDEQAHKFNINLPNVDLSGDFTLQFRFYQSSTAAPSFDSTISAGSQTIMKLSGSAVQTGGSAALFTMPIGTWNELCVMRSGAVLYYYLNGILQTSTQAATGSLGNSFTFDFGSVQQTYKYLDEMRVTREALYLDNGSPANYTPSSVPFDTNLTLVLPDEDVPIADEYVTVSPAADSLYSLLLSNLSSFSVTELPSPVDSTPSSSESDYSALPLYSLCHYGGVSFGLGNASSLISFSGPPETLYKEDSTSYFEAYNNSLFLTLGRGFGNGRYSGDPFSTSRTDLQSGKSYIFSVVCSDGTVNSLSFRAVASISGAIAISSVVSSGDGPFSLGMGVYSKSTPSVRHGSSGYHHPGLLVSLVCPSLSADVAYMELVEGTSPGYTLEYHYATYSPEALKGSPVLAVQTNLVNQSKNENLYTIGNDVVIGGPRPSYPTRGMVWALVEDGYITSLQQYDGFGWNAVNGRIWTGERWVPYYSYNILTLQDYYDIVGNDYNGNEYIYTESGFWSWWQKAWAAFIVKFDKLAAALTGSSQIDEDLLPDADPDGVDEDGKPSGGFSFLALLGVLVSGTWGVVKGLVRIGGSTFGTFVQQITWIPSGLDSFDPKSSDGIYYMGDE